MLYIEGNVSAFTNQTILRLNSGLYLVHQSVNSLANFMRQIKAGGGGIAWIGSLNRKYCGGRSVTCHCRVGEISIAAIISSTYKSLNYININPMQTPVWHKE